MGASIGVPWPGGIIPYVIDPDFTNRSMVFAALREFEEKTNVRFVRRRSWQGSYIELVYGGRCESLVGMQGGRQTVACNSPYASLRHELCHALGMIHEHQRSDRDRYVVVHAENIVAGSAHNFARERRSRNSLEYDFKSLLHYDAFAQSNGEGPTLSPVVAGTRFGDAVGLSARDIWWLGMEYPSVGVVRRSASTSAVEARDVSAAALLQAPGTRGDLVTAIRTESGRLRLARWSVGTFGAIVKVVDSPEDSAASSVDIARGLNDNRLVAAIRDGSGRLKLVAWDAREQGFTRLGDSAGQAGAATEIRIAAVAEGLFVTACRSGQRRLLLISWRLNSDGSLTRLDDSGHAGDSVTSVTLVRLSGVGAGLRVATTVMTNGRLRLILWAIDEASGVFTRLGDSGNSLPAGTWAAMASVSPGRLLLSYNKAGGGLHICSFSVKAGGDVELKQTLSYPNFRINRSRLIARPYGALSAVTNTNGEHRLLKWKVHRDGRISQHGESGDQAGERITGTLVAVSNEIAPLVTAVLERGRHLELISWDDSPKTGDLER